MKIVSLTGHNWFYGHVFINKIVPYGVGSVSLYVLEIQSQDQLDWCSR
jgi:hypothetical protein